MAVREKSSVRTRLRCVIELLRMARMSRTLDIEIFLEEPFMTCAVTLVGNEKIASSHPFKACFTGNSNTHTPFVKSRTHGMSGACEEACDCTPHKQNRRLTPPGGKEPFPDGN